MVGRTQIWQRDANSKYGLSELQCLLVWFLEPPSGGRGKVLVNSQHYSADPQHFNLANFNFQTWKWLGSDCYKVQNFDLPWSDHIMINYFLHNIISRSRNLVGQYGILFLINQHWCQECSCESMSGLRYSLNVFWYCSLNCPLLW